MKISVIICAYNMEKYIDKCLRSAVSQTYRDYEIVLINDGSTDSTEERCRKWVQRESRIRFMSKENEGLGISRNRGIKAASGEYVTFLDADDWLKEDYLEKLAKSAEQYDSDIVLSDICYVSLTDGEEQEKASIIRLNEGVVNLTSEINAFGKCRTFMCCKLFRRNLFIENDLWIPDHNYEDISLTPYLIYKADIVTYIPGTFYYYLRNRTESIINDFHQLSFVRISLEELMNRFKGDGSFEKNRASLLSLFWGQVCHVYNVTDGKFGKEDTDKIKTVREELKESFVSFFPEGKSLVENRYYADEELLRRAIEHIVISKNCILNDPESADVIVTYTNGKRYADHHGKIVALSPSEADDRETAIWNYADEIINQEYSILNKFML